VKPFVSGRVVWWSGVRQFAFVGWRRNLVEPFARISAWSKPAVAPVGDIARETLKDGVAPVEEAGATHECWSR